MAGLRLYAIGIDEVRDLVGATAEVAERARADAAGFLTAATPARSGGLLTRLLRSRPEAPALGPDQPTGEDLETLLSGHYPTPERALACWNVLEHLVARRAWSALRLDLDERALADFDFALVRSGGSAEAGLARVVDSDARIGLCPTPGLRVGYVPYAIARHGGETLSALDLGRPETTPALREFGQFLARYPAWAVAAVAAHRPAPDLVAFHTSAAPVG